MLSSPKCDLEYLVIYSLCSKKSAHYFCSEKVKVRAISRYLEKGSWKEAGLWNFMKRCFPIPTVAEQTYKYRYYENKFLFLIYPLQLLRDQFQYKPVLSKQQFLQYGFAERKIQIVCDIISYIYKRHKEFSNMNKVLKTNFVNF